MNPAKANPVIEETSVICITKSLQKNTEIIFQDIERRESYKCTHHKRRFLLQHKFFFSFKYYFKLSYIDNCQKC